MLSEDTAQKTEIGRSSDPKDQSWGVDLSLEVETKRRDNRSVLVSQLFYA
jgi:hypothetical protein